MAGTEKVYPLNVTTIIIQSTSSNLQSLIGPLTTLDNILSNDVRHNNIIRNNKKDASVLKHLFSVILSKKEYIGNKYILDTFNTFIMNKKRITISISKLHKFCKNEELSKLMFGNFSRKAHREFYPECIEEENQNLLNPDILKIFKNVTHLKINCEGHPFSFEYLLSLIKETKIKKIEIYAGTSHRWDKLKSSSAYDEIAKKYKKAKFIIKSKTSNQFTITRI